MPRTPLIRSSIFTDICFSAADGLAVEALNKHAADLVRELADIVAPYLRQHGDVIYGMEDGWLERQIALDEIFEGWCNAHRLTARHGIPPKWLASCLDYASRSWLTAAAPILVLPTP